MEGEERYFLRTKGCSTNLAIKVVMISTNLVMKIVIQPTREARGPEGPVR